MRAGIDLTQPGPHCLDGLGRTGMLVSCVPIEHGLESDEAVQLTRDSSPGTMQPSGQEGTMAKGRVAGREQEADELS